MKVEIRHEVLEPKLLIESNIQFKSNEEREQFRIEILEARKLQREGVNSE